MPYRTWDFPTACEAGLRDKVDAIAAWSRFAEQLSEHAHTAAQTREERMDADRRLAALERTRSAIESRSLTLAGDTKVQVVKPCALLVHRNEWVRSTLAAELDQRGVTTVADADDGAEGLGVTIVEQPDLLFVEDRLPSVTPFELVNDVQLFSPNTLITAQVEHPEEIDGLIWAGVAAVFGRRVPPAEIAQHLEMLLRDRPEQPIVVQ